MSAEPDLAFDEVLFDRQVATMVAAWAGIAAGSPGAEVVRRGHATLAVFRRGPERTFYNNAILDRGLSRADAASAVSAVVDRYSDAGIGAFAVWAHEPETGSIAEMTAAGLAFDSATRAMAMRLDDLRSPRPAVPLAPPDWATYLRVIEVPDDLARDVDREHFHVRIAMLDGRPAAAAMAFDHDGDCGIYNVGTLAHARRRGLGAALTAVHLHDARDRGCATASLQATPMAERMYASLGFHDLGRWIEHVPALPAPGGAGDVAALTSNASSTSGPDGDG